MFALPKDSSFHLSLQWSNRFLRTSLTHLLSAFLCKCSFRYQSSRLFLGRKSETASARSCHPWISTYWAGLVLQSKIVEVEWPCMSGGLWEVEAVDCASAFSPLPFAAGLCVSQVKSDCVAQRRSCCNGMLAYYYVPEYYIYSANPIAFILFFIPVQKVNALTFYLITIGKTTWQFWSNNILVLRYIFCFTLFFCFLSYMFYLVNRCSFSMCVYSNCMLEFLFYTISVLNFNYTINLNIIIKYKIFNKHKHTIKRIIFLNKRFGAIVALRLQELEKIYLHLIFSNSLLRWNFFNSFPWN